MERCWGMWMEDKEDQGGKFILSKIQFDMYFITIEMTMISYMRKKTVVNKSIGIILFQLRVTTSL